MKIVHLRFWVGKVPDGNVVEKIAKAGSRRGRDCKEGEKSESQQGGGHGRKSRGPNGWVLDVEWKVVPGELERARNSSEESGDPVTTWGSAALRNHSAASKNNSAYSRPQEGTPTTGEREDQN